MIECAKQNVLRHYGDCSVIIENVSRSVLLIHGLNQQQEYVWMILEIAIPNTLILLQDPVLHQPIANMEHLQILLLLVVFLIVLKVGLGTLIQEYVSYHVLVPFLLTMEIIYV